MNDDYELLTARAKAFNSRPFENEQSDEEVDE
jgi:hypothetical protein